MNRTLKRPMFRMGGSSATGITSGLDMPRTSYQFGGGTDARFFIGDRMMPQTAEGNVTSDASDLTPGQELLKAFEDREKANNLSNFLINFGLNLASATPRGSGITGTFATAAEAAKKPFGQFTKNLDVERGFDRNIKLAATKMDINERLKKEAEAREFERQKTLKNLEALNKKTRTLTEPEIKELNLPEGTVAQVKSDDTIDIISKPTAKEIEKRADYANTIGLLNKIEENYFAAGKPVGPFYNIDPDRLKGTVQQFTGGEQGKLLADLEADIKKTTVFLTKAISGAQVSDKEREFIMQLIPQISDTEVQFERKLKSLRSYLADAAKNFGGDVESLMKAGVSAKNYIPTEDKKNLEDMSDSELEAYRQSLLNETG